MKHQTWNIKQQQEEQQQQQQQQLNKNSVKIHNFQ